MRSCPACASEVPAGVERCPDCRLALGPPVDETALPETDPDPADLVTIASFDTPIAASLLVSRLEGEGIQAFLADAETVSADPFLALPVGGVKVQVRSTDAAPAAELARRPRGAETPQAGDLPCPRCGSLATMNEGRSERALGLSMLLLGVPISPKSRNRKCIDCAHRWVP